MTAIQYLYNETVSVKRLADVASTNQQEYGNHIASLQVFIEPFDASLSPDIPGGFGQDWLMYCDVADIDEGDRVFRGSDEYRITGVERFVNGTEPHLEVRIRTFES